MNRNELISLYTNNGQEESWEANMVSVIMDAPMDERKALFRQALTEIHNYTILTAPVTAAALILFRKKKHMKRVAQRFLKRLLLDELRIDDDDTMECLTRALFGGDMKKSRAQIILGGLAQLCIFPCQRRSQFFLPPMRQ